MTEFGEVVFFFTTMTILIVSLPVYIADVEKFLSMKSAKIIGVVVLSVSGLYFFSVHIPNRLEAEEVKRRQHEAECVPDNDLYDLAVSSTEPDLLKIRVAKWIENGPCISRHELRLLKEEVAEELAQKELESRKRQEETKYKQGKGYRALIEHRYKHEQWN